jgi:hypothetical protein
MEHARPLVYSQKTKHMSHGYKERRRETS